jgi:hypothetical protein
MYEERTSPATYVEGGQEFEFSDDFQSTINDMSRSLAADLRARTVDIPDAALIATVLDPRLKRQYSFNTLSIY